MNGLREKIRNKKGFTLVEMLIVVAIIAILIAVSIPLVGNSLERARHSTDAANERAAKAEILLQYMAAKEDVKIYADGSATTALTGTDAVLATDGTTAYYYDAANGRLCKANTGINPYGQHKSTAGGDHTTNGILQLTISAEGTVTMSWGASGTTLCSTAKDLKHTTT